MYYVIVRLVRGVVCITGGMVITEAMYVISGARQSAVCGVHPVLRLS